MSPNPPTDVIQVDNNAPHQPADPPPMSRLRQWMAILSVSFGAFALVTSEFLPVGILTLIAADLGISEGTAGLMITVPAIAGAVAAPLVAVWLSHVQRQWILWIAMTLMVFCHVVMYFAPQFWLLLLARVFLGVSITAFWAIAISLSARLAPQGVSIGLSTSIIVTGITLATTLGVPMGTWLGETLGWRMAFGSMMGLGVLALIWQAWALPRLPASAQKIGFKDLLAIFRFPKARLGLGVLVLAVIAHFATFTYVRVLFNEGGHYSAAFVSSLLLIYGVAGLVGNWLAGYGASKQIHTTFLVVMLSFFVMLLLATVLATSAATSVVLMLLWGLIFAAIPVCANVWMFMAVPQLMENGTGSAMVVFVFQSMIAIGSFFGGFTVDHFGVSPLMFGAAILPLLAVMLLLLFRKNSVHLSAADPCT
ncbi:MAG: MFS transporter [Pseudomonadota bacterium]|nr:MFS transporter [Pseudomonadota bacterium]